MVSNAAELEPLFYEEGAYQKLFNEYIRNKLNRSVESLLYIDGKRKLCVNYYTLGIILGKIEFLSRFIKTGGAKESEDYHEVVGEWLGKTNIADTRRQNSIGDLAALLEMNLDTELSEEAFKAIHFEIVSTYMKLTGKYIAPKRVEGLKDTSLNEELKKIGVNYRVHKFKDKKTDRITWTITKEPSQIE